MWQRPQDIWSIFCFVQLETQAPASNDIHKNSNNNINQFSINLTWIFHWIIDFPSLAFLLLSFQGKILFLLSVYANKKIHSNEKWKFIILFWLFRHHNRNWVNVKEVGRSVSVSAEERKEKRKIGENEKMLFHEWKKGKKLGQKKIIINLISSYFWCYWDINIFRFICICKQK